MKIPKRRHLAMLAGVAVVAAGITAGAGASTAYACTGPTGSTTTGGYGGNCQGSTAVQFGGTITVPSAISFTTDVGAFQFNTGTDGIGVLADNYRVDMDANDSLGVSMFLAGPPGGTFTGDTGSIPDTFISVATVGTVSGTANGTGGICGAAQRTGNTQSMQPLQVGGTQFSILNDTNPVTGTLTCQPNTTAGWDSFGFQGVELNSIPAGLSAGTFSGALTLSQWGN